MRPVGGIEVGFQRFKPLGMLANKGFVNDAGLTFGFRLFVHRQQNFHHPF